EIYDPATSSFYLQPPMLTHHEFHTATLLGNGKVLIAGGILGPLDVSELYAPGVVATIMIKPPAPAPVPVNLSSGCVLPVSILTPSTFDARTVDPTTVTLQGAAVGLKGKGTLQVSVQDVNRDGLPDLVIQVNTGALMISIPFGQAVQAVLT